MLGFYPWTAHNSHPSPTTLGINFTAGGPVAARPADAPLDDTNLGVAMLKGMGWTEGRGLGAGG